METYRDALKVVAAERRSLRTATAAGNADAIRRMRELNAYGMTLMRIAANFRAAGRDVNTGRKIA